MLHSLFLRQLSCATALPGAFNANFCMCLTRHFGRLHFVYNSLQCARTHFSVAPPEGSHASVACAYLRSSPHLAFLLTQDKSIACSEPIPQFADKNSAVLKTHVDCCLNLRTFACHLAYILRSTLRRVAQTSRLLHPCPAATTTQSVYVRHRFADRRRSGSAVYLCPRKCWGYEKREQQPQARLPRLQKFCSAHKSTPFQ